MFLDEKTFLLKISYLEVLVHLFALFLKSGKWGLPDQYPS